jgi:hypothetical protein
MINNINFNQCKRVNVDSTRNLIWSKVLMKKLEFTYFATEDFLCHFLKEISWTT